MATSGACRLLSRLRAGTASIVVLALVGVAMVAGGGAVRAQSTAAGQLQVAGTVTSDADGSPVAGVVVRLYVVTIVPPRGWQGWAVVGLGVTDGAGHYSLAADDISITDQRVLEFDGRDPVSYTHLTLPTILRV